MRLNEFMKNIRSPRIDFPFKIWIDNDPTEYNVANKSLTGIKIYNYTGSMTVGSMSNISAIQTGHEPIYIPRKRFEVVRIERDNSLAAKFI